MSKLTKQEAIDQILKAVGDNSKESNPIKDMMSKAVSVRDKLFPKGK